LSATRVRLNNLIAQEARVRVCIALFAAAACLATPSHAQTTAAGDQHEARIEDIITASHILTNEGILDSFGHVSALRLNGDRYIHCQIYKARSDVQSVIHTHDLAVIPFGVADVPLKPVVAQAGFLPQETPLFEIREANASEPKRGMLVLDAQLGDALARKLGTNPVVLMRGHGDTVVDAALTPPQP
jgi:Class II Aldolase and Adducin N-terminal domain